ncbi:endolytic transglycosylase MltG [Fundicoccus culcitae]|uniref:Endolytic murein transglycosylase n=1 Tax=Fundicoccus culcitae TaxID=2969821 RepID=A0ABY5P5L3_9LACT|nr:endolytic transglycosylase MltG [Fundicoccus culcitae]UUX34043.1 endolytic transglycosylase MltG [Fundicoccus culcitae]
MAKINWKDIRLRARKNEDQHVKEKLWTNRIIKIIMITFLVVLIVVGIGGYVYITNALSPVNPDSNEAVEVTIPIGSSSNDVATLLEENNLIRNAEIFTLYMRSQNMSDLQAGHYEFTQSMDVQHIISVLDAGGEPIFEDIDTNLTVIEGMQIEEIADMVEAQTPITRDEFITAINDEAFLADLTDQFPSLLGGLSQIEDLRYPLEGYLFPATYDYIAGTTAEELITQMVSTMNIEYQAIRDDVDQTWMTFHQVLTLASIIEKEAVTQEDRDLIAGVFLNRINAGMNLESDITVSYALGEHREFVTLSDLEVDSPYNLYMYPGMGPGPYNSPSMSAIMSAIYPAYNDYYYFVADIDTGEVFFSSTYEEHMALVEIYVNQRQSSILEEQASDETTETIIDESNENDINVEETIDESAV